MRDLFGKTGENYAGFLENVRLLYLIILNEEVYE